MLELNRISLSYPADSGRRAVLRELSLNLESGQIACLLGSSGCGKTSVLRAIAGFEPLDGGSIRLDGRLLSGDGARVEPEHRRVGMMFQDYALFPHLDVAANVGFGLRRLDTAERGRRVRGLLELVGLSDRVFVLCGGRFRSELSGGEINKDRILHSLLDEEEQS